MSPLLRRKEPPSLPSNDDESARAFCDRLIGAFAEKAHHNKRESLLSFWIVLIGTLSTPLFIAFGHLITGPNDVWTRFVPALLSVIAAGSTAWLQLRKPQQLWALYRDAQRRLEDLRNRHRYELDEFSNDDRDQRLAAATTKIALSVHHKWMPMIPNPENLGSISAGQPGLAAPGGKE